MVRDRVSFEHLTPLFPDEKFNIADKESSISTRIMDLFTPIGKGQRGMIVSQPKTGKTMLLKDVANAIDNVLEKDIKGVYNLHHKNYKIIDIAEAIVQKIPSAKIETTPMKFQDSRNYQVSSEKLFKETGFEALIDLKTGINEIHDLIANDRIKNVNHKRYSNQNFLEEYGIS